jgi:hypothetical protein
MTLARLLYALPVTCVLIAFSSIEAAARAGEDVSVVVRWNDALLEAVRETRMPPPQVARALAIVHTSMFDAWAAYDARAVGTRLGGRLRRPVYERTEWNKAEAISVAAHRALVDLFPSKRVELFDPLLAELGYTSRHNLADLSTPAGIGYAAADAVIALRHHDGANQLGELSPSGLPYADYTGYVPANDPFTLTDPNRWQPLLQADGNPQRFLVPHWGRVTPFALRGPSQFRPAAPAAHGTRAYWKQALELAYTSATLTDRTKAIAVYWADGPSTETPPGHWMLFAQAISRRDRYTIDKDVKMFFALGNALLDASIAAWDCKVAFDYVRPTSALRLLFAGHTIPAWSGPFRGTELIDGSTWQSYIPTPPFAEHVSGHSAFSAAASTVLRRFTGKDVMRLTVTVPAGASPIEPGFAPASDVTLTWRTFTEAADQAGLSRRFGGIHFRDGDLAGRAIGRQVGTQAWKKAAEYFLGDVKKH